MKSYFGIFFFVVGCGLGTTAVGQTVERPVVHEGDKWTYRIQTDQSDAGTTSSKTERWEASVSRAGSQTVGLSRKRVDSSVPAQEYILNVDWSVTRSLNGKNTVMSRPYDFPMQPGKIWKIETLEEKSSGPFKTQKIVQRYKVIGWEEVKVPAGIFKALKVEVEGEWTQEFERRGPAINSGTTTGPAGATIVMQSRTPETPETQSGRMYKAFWYVPEIKRDVKMIEENTRPNGNLDTRNTQELESFSVN